ncbi:rCG63113 [Rattus norvegicus]|uniref:RCG63113 n=1 Tax=Rattus norvegicus TaxID=10116 RepID=A6K3Q8_RAT|nr:rCG63113 [Rattus norvegicus]
MGRGSGFTPVSHHKYPELRLGVWELSFLSFQSGSRVWMLSRSPKFPFA